MDILPVGEGMRRQPRVLFPVPIGVEPFIALLTTGIPSYGALVTVEGQREPKKVQQWDAKTGAMQQLADEAIVFAQADLSKRYSCVKILLKDGNMGQMFADSFTVAMVTTTVTGGDEIADEPGVSTETSTALAPFFVSLADQYDYDGNGRRFKRGDAMIQVRRDEVIQVLLESASCFEITPMGQPMQRYTLWDSNGIKTEQTYDYSVYLKRLR